MNCPKCNSVAVNITPIRQQNKITVFGCQVCGYAFDGSGNPVVSNTKQLADVFRAATEGSKVLQEQFKIKDLDPATKAAITANLIEYGVTMWFDGLKQGILLSTVSEVYNGNGEVGSTEGNLI